MRSTISDNMYALTYEKGYTTFFDKAFVAFGIFCAIKESQLDYYDGILRMLKYASLIISIGFSFLSILHNYKWSFVNKVGFVLLFFIPLYLRIRYTSNVLISSMLILAAYNIPFSHIVKQCIRVISIYFFIVLFSLGLGLVEDRLYFHNQEHLVNDMAHDLGFKYYSYSYYGMGAVQCCLYYWRNKIDLKRILFLLLISYLFFLVSTVRLQMYACIAFISIIMLIPYIPKLIIDNKLLAKLSTLAYPLICLSLYFVSKYFLLSIFYDGYEELNIWTSGRLALNEEALMRYDANLWGNELDLDTSQNSKDYFYIDSGYLHVLLGDGIVFTAIILLLYSFITFKVFKAKAYFLYMWILIYAVLNISNGFLVSLLANPILLLAFSDKELIAYDYYHQDIVPKTQTCVDTIENY